MKFAPREGFSLSSGICIYDENNCPSEIRRFFRGWEGGKRLFRLQWAAEDVKYVLKLIYFTFSDSCPLFWLPWFRFSPMVFLYLSTVIPSIWFLELSLLQSKLPLNNSSSHELHLLTHIPITVVRHPPRNYPLLPRVTCNRITDMI